MLFSYYSISCNNLAPTVCVISSNKYIGPSEVRAPAEYLRWATIFGIFSLSILLLAAVTKIPEGVVVGDITDMHPNHSSTRGDWLNHCHQVVLCARVGIR